MPKPIHDLSFIVPITVTIPAQITDKAKTFAGNMGARGQSQDYYASKRNTDRARADKDIKMSKLGEWAVEHVLSSFFGFPKIEVNFDVQRPKEKSWKPDLDYPPPFPPVHVKTTPRDYGRGLSWTFQFRNNSGAGGTDGLFFKIRNFDLEQFSTTRRGTTDAPDRVAYVHVPEPDGVAHVMAFTSWKAVVERGLLRDPIRTEFLGIKLCVYYNDLVKAFPPDPCDEGLTTQRASI